MLTLEHDCQMWKCVVMSCLNVIIIKKHNSIQPLSLIMTSWFNFPCNKNPVCYNAATVSPDTIVCATCNVKFSVVLLKLHAEKVERASKSQTKLWT